MADPHANAFGFQFSGDRRGGGVGTFNGKAARKKHFRESAHAGATDADQVKGLVPIQGFSRGERLKNFRLLPHLLFPTRTSSWSASSSPRTPNPLTSGPPF